MSPAIKQTEEKYGIKSDVLPPRLQNQLDDLVTSDEEILWQGRPAPPKGEFFGGFWFALFIGQFWILGPLAHSAYVKEPTGLYVIEVIGCLLFAATLLGLCCSHHARTLSNNAVYAITSNRSLILKPKSDAVIIPPDQMSKRKFTWDSHGYETLILPTGQTYLSVWASPDGASEIVAKYGYLSRVKDIRRVDRLIYDTFEKQSQPQVSIAPINSRTSLI